MSVTALEGHLVVQRCLILDKTQYIRTVLLFTRLRLTLLTTSHLWVLAKGARKIEEMTASKIFQIRHDASEAKITEAWALVSPNAGVCALAHEVKE